MGHVVRPRPFAAWDRLGEYHAGEPGELPIRTQSWGQLEKSGDADFLRSIGVMPGTACNGHLSGLK